MQKFVCVVEILGLWHSILAWVAAMQLVTVIFFFPLHFFLFHYVSLAYISHIGTAQIQKLIEQKWTRAHISLDPFPHPARHQLSPSLFIHKDKFMNKSWTCSEKLLEKSWNRKNEKKNYKSSEQVMSKSKSWTNCGQVVNNHEQVRNKLWTSYAKKLKFFNKFWTSHDQVMKKLYEEVVNKKWTRHNGRSSYKAI